MNGTDRQASIADEADERGVWSAHTFAGKVVIIVFGFLLHVRRVISEYGRDMTAGVVISILVIGALFVNTYFTSIGVNQASASEIRSSKETEGGQGTPGSEAAVETPGNAEPENQAGSDPGPVVSGQDAQTPEKPATIVVNGTLLAIVIDDLGWNDSLAADLFKLKYPMTVSVIPFTPFAWKESVKAGEAGYEVFAHIPMEATGPDSLGWLKKYAIGTWMNKEEVRRMMDENLKALPKVTGFNNHMGSKACTDRATMENVVTVAKERGLLVLDSVTTNKSVLGKVATEMGVGVAVNSLFIDNVKNVKDIRLRLLEAAAISHWNGKAVVIGHMHQATVKAIELTQPELSKMGVNLVTLSQFMAAKQIELPEQKGHAFEIPKTTGPGLNGVGEISDGIQSGIRILPQGGSGQGYR